MVRSTRPNPEGHEPELPEHSPTDESFKLMFAQCPECGAVLGVQDYYNVDAVVEEQNRVLRGLAERIESTKTPAGTESGETPPAIGSGETPPDRGDEPR